MNKILYITILFSILLFASFTNVKKSGLEIYCENNIIIQNESIVLKVHYFNNTEDTIFLPLGHMESRPFQDFVFLNNELSGGFDSDYLAPQKGSNNRCLVKKI